jgi:hypothetical protein
LQDRLPKALALAGITTIAAANRWLAETYWLAHNAAFAVTPAEAGSAFVRRSHRPGARHPVHPGAPRRQRQHRKVAGPGAWIPPSPLRAHFVRTTVRVHDLPATASAGRLRPRGKAAR